MADSTLGTLFRPVTAPVNAVAERLRPFIAPIFQGGVQAQGPQAGGYPSIPPASSMQGPFAGPPEPAHYSSRIGAPPASSGRFGSLPAPPEGVSAGWISAPAGARFDAQTLAPPPAPGASFDGTVTSPAGNTYSVLPHGSLVDLEGQARTRNLLDAIYPELAPQNQGAVAEQALKARLATPLRPGEQAPILPQAAMAQQAKDQAFRGLQTALADWDQRKQAAMAQFEVQAAHLPRAQAEMERQRLEDHFKLEAQTITLRYAPELAPGFKSGLEDLE